MKESELKIGIKVKAILREDGKHIIVGEILNITLDNHPYHLMAGPIILFIRTVL